MYRWNGINIDIFQTNTNATYRRHKTRNKQANADRIQANACCFGHFPNGENVRFLWDNENDAFVISTNIISVKLKNPPIEMGAIAFGWMIFRQMGIVCWPMCKIIICITAELEDCFVHISNLFVCEFLARKSAA